MSNGERRESARSKIRDSRSTSEAAKAMFRSNNEEQRLLKDVLADGCQESTRSRASARARGMRQARRLAVVCEYYDDISGAQLDHAMVTVARRKDIDLFKSRVVYTKAKQEQWMKIISTKWLDQNKGDATAPNYQSRLVGCEFAVEKRDDLFAATPPLESLRLMCSICASNQSRGEPYRLMAIDVKREFFMLQLVANISLKFQWRIGNQAMR